jgi:hypothetical protein
MLLLSVMFLAITPAPGHAQGREEVVLYEENFNDNQAQDWELDQGWTVTEGMSRYFIGFREGGLYLSKQDRLGNFFEGLAESSVSRGLNKWYNIEIIGEGPLIQVFVDEKLELDYTDPEPLLSGSIAFETLEGGVAQVDDIIVIGPLPAWKGPDLAILSTDHRFENDGRVLVLLVEVVNQGNNVASATQVFVGDIEYDWLNEISLIQDLGPEETIWVEIRLAIPEELRGTIGMFRVVVDPENGIREIDEENNEVMTPRIQFETKAVAEVTDDPDEKFREFERKIETLKKFERELDS